MSTTHQRNANNATQTADIYSHTVNSTESLRHVAVVLIFPLLAWLLGRVLGNLKAKQDAIVLFLLTTYFCRSNAFALFNYTLAVTGNSWLYILPLLSLNAIQILYLPNNKSSSFADDKPSTTLDIGSSSPLKPLFFPSITRHTRLFPRPHSFNYSYFLVGVPVGWRGRVNNILSSDEAIARQRSWWNEAWFSVSPDSYLFYTEQPPNKDDKLRECRAPSLREKLDAYLQSEGVDPTRHPHAYLVTAPRVLGFSFNPVSFWYLYDKDMSLTGMVLEVNNTFGERRMYFLQPSDGFDATEGSSMTQISIEGGGMKGREIDGSEKKPKKFKARWNKDFHVSPFNDREGIYSMTALDPFASVVKHSKAKLGDQEQESDVRINNIITLSSRPYTDLSPSPEQTSSSSSSTSPSSSTSSSPPQQQEQQPSISPKIVASIASTTTITPSDISSHPLKFISFLFKTIWIGFLTDPRILYEARTLWTMGLKVWYRPEPRQTTVGRKETPEEEVVERMFEWWLRDVVRRVRHSAKSEEGKGGDGNMGRVRVRYHPAAGPGRGRSVLITDDDDDDDDEDGIPIIPTDDDGDDNNVSRTKHQAEGEQIVTINLKILTPAFYSTLITAPSLLTFWETHCLNTQDGEAMVEINEDAKETWWKVVFDSTLQQSSEIRRNTTGSGINGGFEIQGSSSPGSWNRIGGLSYYLLSNNSNTGVLTSLARYVVDGVGLCYSSISGVPSRFPHLRGARVDSTTKTPTKVPTKVPTTPTPDTPFLDLILADARLLSSSSASTPPTSSSTALSSSVSQPDLQAFTASCLRILVSDRVALGSTALLRFYGTMIRWILILCAARGLGRCLGVGNGTGNDSGNDFTTSTNSTLLNPALVFHSSAVLVLMGVAGVVGRVCG